MPGRIYSSRDERFKKPFGAVKSGQKIEFNIYVPAKMGVEKPVIFIEKEGEYPVKHRLKQTGSEKTNTIFSAEITLEETGLYFYWFDLWKDFKKLYMGKNGKSVLTEKVGEKYPLTVYSPDFETPESMHGGVMYQIFPDRFCEGSPEKEMPFPERVYRADKHNPPFFWWEEKSYGSLTQDYYGGDFAGIEKRLPFLKSLGVDIIYLNPVFEAHSNHRYNTADYMKIDPCLGTNEDFARLCKTAGGFGIRIILDGVFSHTGSDSIYFNKNGRYPGAGAWQSKESPYRGWYTFEEDGSYDSWWGFDTLPNCDKTNRGFRNFICGEGGVIDYWLKMGASGFRLDVADELPDDFIEEIRTAVKRGGKENLLIGEVWEDAALKEAYNIRRKYFLGKELDGVMNYPFRTAILEFLQGGGAQAFESAVMSICENYPAPALAACTTHISTHDTVRAITELAGEKADKRDRSWQCATRLSEEEYRRGVALMRLAFVLQFTLPGIPCVYYGDEIAMQGYADPFNRAYYNWNSSEGSLIPLMIQLSALRHACPAFKQGDIFFKTAVGGVLVYERQHGESVAEIAVNLGALPAVVNLAGGYINLPPMGHMIKATGFDYTADAGL